MGQHTPLYDWHVAQAARMVPFGGWDMPLHYGSQLDEHHQVRRDAGLFDVSHMTAIDFTGAQAQAFLRHLLANDVARLQPSGKALYSCMLQADGGVIDDLIVYYMHDQWYRMVVNAGTTEKDLAWIEQQAQGFEVTVQPRQELAMLAIQGPQARSKTIPLLAADAQSSIAALKPFQAQAHADWFIGRTGYTGEDGFEVMLPQAQAVGFCDGLLAAGVQPCGLGARDTLRLEAGMNLYGSDMDESTSPLVSGLGWTIAWEPQERHFVGREALQKQRGQLKQRFVGLLLQDKGVLRNHLPLFEADRQIGEITSGGFSPTLKRSIALARIATDADHIQVEVRGKRLNVRIVKPPFVRNGQAKIELD
ncbi:MAG: glycine cleavage system aminomethyltransferase GcvT [gamma proteobacterium symbiont of Bathyaustriella thionipta]|nr:glycine cleavage system aminomethyltransferase GcvT [gamma proteobacterium symbiont of Bathyaustriella thionipta]